MRRNGRAASLLLAAALLLCACAAPAQKAPEKHVIPFDSALDTTNDEYGADAFAGSLDQADTRYYAVNDYYNMKSGGSLHILPGYETYQQTTEYTCGCAAALMALWHYGIRDYNEMQICELAGTDPSKGTPVDGLISFLESTGMRLDCHADTGYRFETIEACEAYLIETLDSGAPILVDWVDWVGHWQTIIGLDTCRSDSPYDDVLIMADSYDVTDHYQDGYYVVPFGRFFYMWREGPCAEKDVPYEQPFITVFPAA